MPYQEVDWTEAFDRHSHDEDWLVEPIIPRGKSIAVYSAPKAGKSIISLYVASRLATGQRVLDQPAGPPIDVMYVDLEMGEPDAVELLEPMGYNGDSDLSHLHYYALPDLPYLDTVDGGKDLRRLAKHHDAQLVIIDTLNMSLRGGENDADTVRAFHNHTGSLLRKDGRTVVRLDHAGKDLERGQRGSSAKAQDVDLVWFLTRQDENTLRLKATHRRSVWAPETVDLVQLDGPLRFERANTPSLPEGTHEAAVELERLGVPVETGVRAAANLLRINGWTGRQNIAAAAVRLRRNDPSTLIPVSGNGGKSPGQDVGSTPSPPSRGEGTQRFSEKSREISDDDKWDHYEEGRW